ncbi:MAG: ParB-like nuclease domain [Candidatus Methanohalarchaeum thermophilum]|uniref:ParB-like nuclease domain n=1 Tax=Methanohalarchaeum thermophilum TaxID=1903181 RepID=A0A1Q6DT13_METT1|nr:MAG: ParB-like nuclease domain [Candidatus Methanohalarchaeum thermophilum]
MKKINLTQIKNKQNPEINLKEMDQLANSIQDIGLKNPIKVKQTDGSYILKDGKIRLEAYQLLGKQKIPAEIEEKTTKTKNK